MTTMLRITILLGVLVAVISPGPSRAEMATAEEARLVAENYVKLIIEKDGSWGGHETARVLPVEPLRREDRLLGYLCPVEPVGYFVISLYRDLAPVRAYSTRSNLDPTEDVLLSDVVKILQEMIHDAVAAKLGRPIDPLDDFRHLLPKQFDQAWEALSSPNFDPVQYRDVPKTRGAGMNYQEGEELLTTTWNQDPPYNNQCPDHGCVWPRHGYYNTNAYTGCVATAGAQILKYWNWPPEGTGNGYDHQYDWPNMAESYCWNDTIGWFQAQWDGVWQPATQEELDAVSLISRKVGVAVNMNYGCYGSGAYTEDIGWALPGYFRFLDQAQSYGYQDHSYSEWWAALKNEFDNNRPVQMHIPGHSIVVDGWRVELGEDQIHVVYGHNGSNDGWCAVNEIPGAEGSSDMSMVRYLLPNCVIGTPREDYPLPTYPYRYFERDFETLCSHFAPGHHLPILRSGFLMTCTGGGPGLDIVFNGEPGAETLLYLNGDPEDESRIRVKDGAFKVLAGGQVVVY